MAGSDANPLIDAQDLPPFSRIRPEHARPAIDALVAESRATVERLLGASDADGWEGLVAPIEAVDERLARAWSPISHLHSVADEPALREAYNACRAILSEHATERGQNEALFRAFERVAADPAFAALDAARRRVVENALREFRLSGVGLDADAKRRFREIEARLSELSSRFSENVLDATQAWSLHVTDEARLAGLPESARRLAADAAAREGVAGWRFTLDFPSFYALVTYADDERLRREAYEAYTTRASDRGPHAGRWDNGPLTDEILALRHEKARLLGFGHFAEYSLARKMARSPDEVIGFLRDLARRARPAARAELAELERFAREHHGRESVEAWDVAYYSEKLRQHRFDLSQEALRPYLPLPRVLEGLFEIVHRLYGMRVRRIEPVDAWHPDVALYEILDADGERRGRFYLDAFARANKRGGAWMGECVVRHLEGGRVRTPVAYLACNFTPPVGDQPALLTHDEMTTLFHEFGHGLHHLLTRIDWPSVAGINGVAWDAVELPSQLMENWCWDREAMRLCSGHWESGEPLPDELLERLRAARTFQAGMKTVRQLEFALFDFRLHVEHDPEHGARVLETLDEVRREVAVVLPPESNRFASAFTHVFGGGYAAGYYSYKWAELLSADAFSRFEERGVLDRATGLDFLHAVLEQGGSRDAMDLFVAFRGREPRIDAMLRHCGIDGAALEGAA